MLRFLYICGSSICFWAAGPEHSIRMLLAYVHWKKALDVKNPRMKQFSPKWYYNTPCTYIKDSSLSCSKLFSAECILLTYICQRPGPMFLSQKSVILVLTFCTALCLQYWHLLDGFQTFYCYIDIGILIETWYICPGLEHGLRFWISTDWWVHDH